MEGNNKYITFSVLAAIFALVWFFWDDISNAVEKVFKGDEAKDKVLKKGSRGMDVRKLQQKLNEVGASDPKLSTDGIFGAKTEAALVAATGQNTIKVKDIDGIQKATKKETNGLVESGLLSDN